MDKVLKKSVKSAVKPKIVASKSKNISSMKSVSLTSPMKKMKVGSGRNSEVVKIRTHVAKTEEKPKGVKVLSESDGEVGSDIDEHSSAPSHRLNTVQSVSDFHGSKNLMTYNCAKSL